MSSSSSAAAIANAANAAADALTSSSSLSTTTTPAASSSSLSTAAANTATAAPAKATRTAEKAAANAAKVAAPTSSSSSTPTAAKRSSYRSVSFHPNAKKSNGPKASPKTAASLAEAATAPVVAAAANAVTNAKNEEICFIYSNACTKGTFKKGCIVVYKGNKTASDRSADMLQQLLAQKDLQVVKGGVQTSFVQSINDKTSLFIAYVEVMNTPTDEQIKTMKDSISKAISKPSPTKGGKRFHTKKRHTKKKTTRRRS